ncbi:MAG TPA: hypothetical protein VM662_13120, partial [Sphingomonas sp.]|nr:hypothetical protein [Sphingomonas sp.]
MKARNAIAIGVSIAAVMWHAAAAAQGAPSGKPAEAPPAVDQPAGKAGSQDAEAESDIVVTGVRQSLRAGIELKRNNTQFVDAIV